MEVIVFVASRYVGKPGDKSIRYDVEIIAGKDSIWRGLNYHNLASAERALNAELNSRGLTETRRVTVCYG